MGKSAKSQSLSSDGHLVFRRSTIAAIKELEHPTLLILATLLFLGGLAWKVIWPARAHFRDLVLPGHVALVIVYGAVPLIVALVWAVAWYDWHNERYEITKDDQIIIVTQRRLGRYSEKIGSLKEFELGWFEHRYSKWLPYGDLVIVVRFGEYRMHDVWRPARKLAMIQRRAEKAKKGKPEQQESVLAQIVEEYQAL